MCSSDLFPRHDIKGGGLLGDMGAAFMGGYGGGGVVPGLLASGSVGAKRLAGAMFKAGKVNERLVAETADQLTRVGADAKQVVQHHLSFSYQVLLMLI